MGKSTTLLRHTITATLINNLLFALFGVKFITDGIQIGSDATGWTIKKASAADVSGGDAHTAGNLIIKNNSSGTKREFEA